MSDITYLDSNPEKRLNILQVLQAAQSVANVVAQFTKVVEADDTIVSERFVFQHIAFFSFFDKKVSDAEIQLVTMLEDFPSFSGGLRYPDHSFSIRTLIENAAVGFTDYEDEIPDILLAAAYLDQSYGSNFATSLGSLLLVLANVVIGLDGKPSIQAQARVFSFRNEIRKFLSSKSLNDEVDNIVPPTSIEFEADEEGLEVSFRIGTDDDRNDQIEELVPPSVPIVSRSADEASQLDQLLLKLDQLIGLTDVKREVNSLVNLVRVRQMREKLGLGKMPMSHHLVFTGNPGTGKTTIARLIAEVFKELGLLSSGHLVEADRSALVAGYVGQTALKVQKIVRKAMGGILFIDEAYSLHVEGSQDYGQEAVDTLLKLMEDHRDDFVVIVAGYTEPMKQFVQMNPGLRSRFNRYIHFPDYTADELRQILNVMTQQYGYELSEDAVESFESVVEKEYQQRDHAFGNARLVRNAFEKMVSNQANRLANTDDLSIEQMVRIISEDVPVDISS